MFILDSSIVYYMIWPNFHTENKERRQGKGEKKREYTRSLLKVTENDRNKYSEQSPVHCTSVFPGI